MTPDGPGFVAVAFPKPQHLLNTYIVVPKCCCG